MQNPEENILQARRPKCNKEGASELIRVWAVGLLGNAHVKLANPKIPSQLAGNQNLLLSKISKKSTHFLSVPVCTVAFRREEIRSGRIRNQKQLLRDNCEKGCPEN